MKTGLMVSCLCSEGIGFFLESCSALVSVGLTVLESCGAWWTVELTFLESCSALFTVGLTFLGIGY